jgi:hypothetical protein
MHIQDFTNSGVFSGGGWLYISTDASIVNNGTIETELLQMESGYFENNDTLQGGIFGYEEYFGVCPGDTNIFVNYGFVDLERAFMPCMRKVENHGVFTAPNGYYDLDTLINTNYLDMVLLNNASSGIYSADVFLNSGYSRFIDGHGNSRFSFNLLVNSDTLIIDSTLIFVDSDFENSGYLALNGTPVSRGAGELLLLNTASGKIVSDTILNADIINEGRLLIGRPGATLITNDLVNSGILQLMISGRALAGADSSYQRIIVDNSLAHIGNSTLEIVLDSFMPAPGDSFLLVEYSLQLGGEFESLQLPNLEDCMSWEAVNSNNDLILYIVESPDSDQDGTLDCDDLCPNDSLKIDPGLCGCGNADLDSDGDGLPDCFDSDVAFTRQSSSSIEGVRLSGLDADSTQLWYLGSVTDTDTSLMLMNRRNEAVQFGTHNTLQMTLDSDGRLGIGKTPSQYRLEVNGQASKSSPGDWLANSDASLKRNIQPLDSVSTFHKLLSLHGVTYQWNEDKQYNRPGGIQYGFTAQNVQSVYPELVQQDKYGWLMTAYGTFDPMFIAAFKALNEELVLMRSTMTLLKERLDNYEAKRHFPVMSKLDKE